MAAELPVRARLTLSSISFHLRPGERENVKDSGRKCSRFESDRMILFLAPNARVMF